MFFTFPIQNLLYLIRSLASHKIEIDSQVFRWLFSSNPAFLVNVSIFADRRFFIINLTVYECLPELLTKE